MRAETVRDPSLAAVGHHFLLGLEESPRLTDHDRRLLELLRPAGIVLFRENFAHGLPYPEWLEELSALLAEVRGAIGRERLLVGIDHEGGRVLRTPPPTTAFAAPRAWRDRAAEVGRAMGRELKALGCNVDFAPVVDVDSNPANPIIGERAFARTAEAVVGPARAFLRGLAAEGVLGCLKHFPGHGDTAVDSHEALPVVDVDLGLLRARELAPFAALAGEAKLVMTAHVVYPRVDPVAPATLSHRFLVEILRDQLGFAGAVVSDDLGMRAVAPRLSARGTAAAAVAAGCDLLLVCAHLIDTSVSLELARDLVAALDTGALPALVEEVSRGRVEALLRIAPQHPVEPLPPDVFERHRRLLAHA